MRLAAEVRATFADDGTDPFEVAAGIDVEDGETLVVLGPSGSGKTLLLESVAGFHDHAGHVRVGDRDVTDAPPEDRGFGFVFQDYALFPHLTVRENVAFGRRYHDDVRDPDDLLADLGVADLAERSPPTLSGGEKQRVALARALAVRPDALLLDEPLSALDVPTRQSLRADLADALADVTGVYVTHNRTTARALADRIAVMHDGEIVQTGAPETVFERPASPFVAAFVGANCLPAEAVPAGVVEATATHVSIRPEHVSLGAGDGPEDGALRGTVTRTLREDAATRVVLELDDGTRLDALVTDAPPAVGETVRIDLPGEHVAAVEE